MSKCSSKINHDRNSFSINIGMEHNPFVILNRPPSISHYRESCKLYCGDICDEIITEKFWIRKLKIYNNNSKLCKHRHVGYYYEDNAYTIEEGEIYFNNLYRDFGLIIIDNI